MPLAKKPEQPKQIKRLCDRVGAFPADSCVTCSCSSFAVVVGLDFSFPFPLVPPPPPKHRKHSHVPTIYVCFFFFSNLTLVSLHDTV